MDAIEAILSRRSIRKYINKPIPKEVIKELLEAGMSAPSAGNEQPWHFILINDPKILKEIPSFHNHAQMLNEASTAILVCNDKRLDKHGEMWIQDCSAATENILIAVNAKGLGGVWLGIYPREERMNGMRKLLSIPEYIIPFSLISIGYPGERKPPANRYDASRVHQNKW
ncbi:MAG: nitroreductase family protein [Candidatus Thermoplasmatota archaeon]|jgi:nitroreductase|nr:nitroreductase family protein [Candidatus Thermoplasmatota archaeon]